MMAPAPKAGVDSGQFTVKARAAGPPSGMVRFSCLYLDLKVIRLSVNGQVQRVEPGADVARLLQMLELSGKRVAVEKNGEIVPRSRYAETRLADGDALEIVVAVGGG
jgi:sulfur carrier protein